MEGRLERENKLVLSYLTLRKVIGILAVSFPLLLFLSAAAVFGEGLQDSLSSYYHTGVRDIFVGVICAIAVFLVSYKGYEPRDNVAGHLACLFAVGAALFPTVPDGPASDLQKAISIVHFIFATLFFLTLIYFSLFLFTKTDPKRPPGKMKRLRIKVYKATGYIMAVCMILVFTYFRLPETAVARLAPIKPVFWLEAITVMSFGVAWLIKGHAILAVEGEDETSPA